MLRISIPQPCHEKWEKMTPVEKGAYCKSCCKEVVDFTSMSDVELSSYLQNNNTQSACGRFRNDQINKPLLYISPDVLSMNIPLWKKFIAALFICFSSFITGCGNKNTYSKAFEVELPSIAPVPRVSQINDKNVSISPDDEEQTSKDSNKENNSEEKSSVIDLKEMLQTCTVGTFVVEDKPPPEPDFVKYLYSSFKYD